MSRFALGDIQGCYDELRALIAQLGFKPDRDRLWFTGDLVNRGPKSLEVLRFVRALGANAVCVLGNHDLHLLAIAFGTKRKNAVRPDDTLDDVLAAPDRDALLEWLLARPLVHFDRGHGDLLVHAGLIPQWSAGTALALAREVETALATEPRNVFDNMYGNEPSKWSNDLEREERLRFAINVFTRLRICTADGRIELKMKGSGRDVALPWRAWFEHENRQSRDVRVIFGHWSARGLVRTNGVVGLDTGCVWGGALTALDLDAADAEPVSTSCAGYHTPGE
ncbi:MAG TPA: symmetrical bis(5'-nucleosyl)-tetraphosphatase [Steroidobacteraceae bacterium]|nr:symmetrical bis(5'-nucleosyl)-tetraphosphatase [Steroidobacteraceae bacterium]